VLEREVPHPGIEVGERIWCSERRCRIIVIDRFTPSSLYLSPVCVTDSKDQSSHLVTMLSRAVPFARVATRSFARPVGSRAFTATIEDASTAADAAALSGYSDIDFVISDDSPVIDAVQRFAAYNIGCLVTTDSAGKSL
jgi:hypothetical protein